MGMCACEYRCPRRSEKDDRFPGAGGTAVNYLRWTQGTEFRPSVRAASTLSH